MPTAARYIGVHTYRVECIIRPEFNGIAILQRCFCVFLFYSYFTPVGTIWLSGLGNASRTSKTFEPEFVHSALGTHNTRPAGPHITTTSTPYSHKSLGLFLRLVLYKVRLMHPNPCRNQSEPIQASKTPANTPNNQPYNFADNMSLTILLQELSGKYVCTTT